MKRLGSHSLLVLSVAVLAAISLSACTVSRQQAVGGRDDVSTFISEFMKDVIEDDWEGAFRSIDIQSLVNYGRPQADVYAKLSEKYQERYRRDFIQGIYSYLYRNTPRGEVEAPRYYFFEDPLTVEVSGLRETKRLHFHLKVSDEGHRIVRVEKGAS